MLKTLTPPTFNVLSPESFHKNLKLRPLPLLQSNSSFPFKNSTAATAHPELAHSRLNQNRNGDKCSWHGSENILVPLRLPIEVLILIPEPKSSLESHPPPLDSREPPPIPRKKATIVFRSKAVGKTDQGDTKPKSSPSISNARLLEALHFSTAKFHRKGTND